MYFLIIAFGLILALRGAKPASLQKPAAGLTRIGRETLDLFLTVALGLTLLACWKQFEPARVFIESNAVLVAGILALLFSRLQKKSDVFFLVAALLLFLIQARQSDLCRGLFLAGSTALGIALFQSGLLGLRHRLLLSRVPAPFKGWPALCLLAAGLSAACGALARFVF